MFFGAEVFLGCSVGLDFAGDAFSYFDAGGFQGGHFLGVVGKESDSFQAQRLQDFSGELELAVVSFEAELLVGLDGIETFVLQFVGLKFSHQPDTATFLQFVNQDAGSGLGDEGERHLQLLSAIAAHGSKYIAGKALGVDAHQRRRRVDVPNDQGDSLFDAAVTAEQALEAHDAKVSPARGKIGLGQLADGCVRCHLIYYSDERLPSRGAA